MGYTLWGFNQEVHFLRAKGGLAALANSAGVWLAPDSGTARARWLSEQGTRVSLVLKDGPIAAISSCVLIRLPPSCRAAASEAAIAPL